MQKLSQEANLQLQRGSPETSQTPPVYPTYGVHNPPEYSPCADPDCLYVRGPGEPSDPILPLYWTAKWKMYRVYRQYAEYPPPYDGSPPSALEEGVDYEVSKGASYDDSTWRGPNGEQGAMMPLAHHVSAGWSAAWIGSRFDYEVPLPNVPRFLGIQPAV
jgi:hypothetical protein